MKTCFAIRWLLFTSLLCTTTISCALSGAQENDVKPRYIGSISKTDDGEILLNTEFINASKKALCLEHWPASLDLIPIEQRGNDFLITLTTGEKAKYIGSTGEFVFTNPDLIDVLVVLPGKSIKAVYRLDKLYSINSDVVSVLSFMAYAECAKYDESYVIQPEPSFFLGIYERYHDMEAFNLFMKSREPLENTLDADWTVLFVKDHSLDTHTNGK